MLSEWSVLFFLLGVLPTDPSATLLVAIPSHQVQLRPCTIRHSVFVHSHVLDISLPGYADANGALPEETYRAVLPNFLHDAAPGSPFTGNSIFNDPVAEEAQSSNYQALVSVEPRVHAVRRAYY